MDFVSISIITICLNAEKNIGKTMDSVFRLESNNYEYIIKDGGSSDNTNKIIESYRKKFEIRGIKFIHKIQSDNGIYNAMNQAISFCSAKWINFMNAGDRFYDRKIITNILDMNILEEVGVIYGHTLYQLSNGMSFISTHSSNMLAHEWSMCHQSIFVRTHIMKKYMFEEKYLIVGDYDLILKLYSNDVKFQRINAIIAIYDRTGISNRQLGICSKENEELQQKYNLLKKKKYFSIFSKIKSKITRSFPSLSDFIFCLKQMKRMKNY